jgi:hypothetical protein
MRLDRQRKKRLRTANVCQNGKLRSGAVFAGVLPRSRVFQNETRALHSIVLICRKGRNLTEFAPKKLV